MYKRKVNYGTPKLRPKLLSNQEKNSEKNKSGANRVGFIFSTLIIKNFILLNRIIQQTKLYFKNTSKNSYNRPQPTFALLNVNPPV